MNQPIQVLLIEDNPSDALLLRCALEEGQNVEFCLTTVERMALALEHLANYPVDVVLLDLVLPDGYGLALVQKLHNRFAAVPIVVLTGHDNRELAMQALESGAQDYLIKGQSDPETLARAIRYAMQRSHVLQELRQAREELEERVQQRTAELAEANEELRAEIVERKRVEASLQQAKAEVETASRARSEFYSRMSHELRTPLSAILGFGQLLSMDELSVRQQQSVTYILQAGQHLLRLVDAVLEIASSSNPNAPVPHVASLTSTTHPPTAPAAEAVHPGESTPPLHAATPETANFAQS